MAQLNNLKFYKAESIRVVFTMQPSSVGDITGWTIQFSLKKRLTDQDPLLQTGCAVLDGPNRQFTLLLSAAQTTIAAGDYAYDIRRIDAGSESVLSIGTLTVLQEVAIL